MQRLRCHELWGFVGPLHWQIQAHWQVQALAVLLSSRGPAPPAACAVAALQTTMPISVLQNHNLESNSCHGSHSTGSRRPRLHKHDRLKSSCSPAAGQPLSLRLVPFPDDADAVKKVCHGSGETPPACLQVGPELEIPGYGCEDHFQEMDTVEHSWECLTELLTGKRTSLLAQLFKLCLISWHHS